MHDVYKNERRQVNKKILWIKERRAYRDGIKRKGDKIGMGSVESSKIRIMREEFRLPEGHYTTPYIVASVLNVEFECSPLSIICTSMSCLSWSNTSISFTRSA